MTPNQTLPSPPPEVPPRRLRLETIVDWEPLVIEANYSVKNLAARCGYSVRSLQRFVSSKFNRGLLDFIADLRLRRARTLLRAGLSEARGEWILTLEPDLSDPGVILTRLWQERERADVTIASRYPITP